MSNTSASGGYLSPTVASPPLEDADLDAVFQRAIVGVTSLDGTLVRPRWQVTPPKQPDPTVNWCAFGVIDFDVDDGPAITHVSTGDGSDHYVRHEDITLACTFYGPLSQRFAALTRDGLTIPQNLEALKNDGLAFIECMDIRSVPELVNQQWIKRYDLFVRFRRQIQRTYQVLNIISADPIIVNDEIGIISN
jgi:hypothetical protein